jgi:hypothetical protein
MLVTVLIVETVISAASATSLSVLGDPIFLNTIQIAAAATVAAHKVSKANARTRITWCSSFNELLGFVRDVLACNDHVEFRFVWQKVDDARLTLDQHTQRQRGEEVVQSRYHKTFRSRSILWIFRNQRNERFVLFRNIALADSRDLRDFCTNDKPTSRHMHARTRKAKRRNEPLIVRAKFWRLHA